MTIRSRIMHFLRNFEHRRLPAAELLRMVLDAEGLALRPHQSATRCTAIGKTIKARRQLVNNMLRQEVRSC